jgi:hypothetical protein
MFHAELFSGSIATGAGAPVQVPFFAPDSVLTPIQLGVQVSPTLRYLHSVAGVGAHLAIVRAQANSMLPFPYNTMEPNNRGAGFESPPRIWDYSRFPIQLKPTEEFDIFASQDSGGAETQYVMVQFSDGLPSPIAVAVNPSGMADNPAMPGRFFSVRWSTATTLTAGQWTQVIPLFDQSLYAGSYQLLGARVKSATGLFFRMFPSQGPGWRPGGVCVNSFDAMDPYNQRYQPTYGNQPGGWGVWLNFFSNTPPKVEILATAADVAQEGYFDVVYTGPTVTGGL